jgi:hypothetical protein
MKTKMLTIAAILAAALLTGIFSATPLATYAEDDDHDEDDYDKDHDDDNGDRDNGDRDNGDRDNGSGDTSITNTEQALSQDNVGSNNSTNFNCGQNLINSPNVDQSCRSGPEPIVPIPVL